MPQHQSVTAARKPASDKSVPNLGRHARKCAICNHAERDSIDADIISWRSASTITLDYALPARSSIYRHAAATGLLQRRQRNLRGACERIIERVDDAPPSASAVLGALRIYSQITEDGQWLEPAKRSIVTHVHITKHEQPPAAANHGGGPENEGARTDEVVGAALRRPQNASAPQLSKPSVQTERAVLRPAARIENPPEDVASAATAPASRDERREADERAAHNNEQPCTPRLEAAESGPEADSPAITTATESAPSPQPRTGGPDLDYLPDWARSLYPYLAQEYGRTKTAHRVASNLNGENDSQASRASEILIGTQNASREEAGSTEEST